MAQLGKEYVIFTDYQNTGKDYLAVSTNGNGEVVVVPERRLAVSGTPKHLIWYKVTAKDAAGGSSSNLQQQEEPFVLVNKTRPQKHNALVVKNIHANGRRQVVLGDGQHQGGERWTTERAAEGFCYIQRASDPNLVFDADLATGGIVELLKKRDPGASNPRASSCWKIVPQDNNPAACPAGGGSYSNSTNASPHSRTPGGEKSSRSQRSMAVAASAPTIALQDNTTVTRTQLPSRMIVVRVRRNK